jgi:hypothetical protein
MNGHLESKAGEVVRRTAPWAKVRADKIAEENQWHWLVE